MIKKRKISNIIYLPDEIWGIIIQYVNMSTLFILFTNVKFIWRIIFENEYHMNMIKQNFNPYPSPEKFNGFSEKDLKEVYKRFTKCIKCGTLNGYTLYGKLRSFNGGGGGYSKMERFRK